MKKEDKRNIIKTAFGTKGFRNAIWTEHFGSHFLGEFGNGLFL